MSKHTPGPWQAYHDHGWLVVESKCENLYVRIEKGSSARKHMPDARLIAAAPELLEALRKLLFADDQEWDAAVVAARAAIARAEGEQA